MKVFKKVEELEKYYDVKKNAYWFIKNNMLLDVKFKFNFTTNAKIYVWNLKGKKIEASRIVANKIKLKYVKAGEIDVVSIKSKQDLSKMYKIINYAGNTLLFLK